MNTIGMRTEQCIIIGSIGSSRHIFIQHRRHRISHPTNDSNTIILCRFCFIATYHTSICIIIIAYLQMMGHLFIPTIDNKTFVLSFFHLFSRIKRTLLIIIMTDNLIFRRRFSQQTIFIFLCVIIRRNFSPFLYIIKIKSYIDRHSNIRSFFRYCHSFGICKDITSGRQLHNNQAHTVC